MRWPLRRTLLYTVIIIVPLGGCASSTRSIVHRYATSENKDHRIWAVKQLTDQALLMDIFNNDDNEDVRRTAVDGITDQGFLKDVASSDDRYRVRTAAAKKITDQDFLMELAKNDRESWVRKAAVEKIIDQDFLKEVVKNDTVSYVRDAAITKITDQDFLMELVTNDKWRWSSVRRPAIKRITDQEFLIGFAEKDTSRRDDDILCAAAIERITDQEFLIDMLMKKEKDLIREAAIRGIQDQGFLIWIAQADQSDRIRLAAAIKVQYLLNVDQYVDFKDFSDNIGIYMSDRDNAEKLMLVILDKRIVDRHGLLRVDVDFVTTTQAYSLFGSHGMPTHDLTVTHYHVKLTNSRGETILDEVFVGEKPQPSETFQLNNTSKYRDAEIDFDGITQKLLNH